MPPLLRVTPSEEGGMSECAVWSYQANAQGYTIYGVATTTPCLP